MSCTIRADIEKLNPENSDGWHHNETISTYLYPDVEAAEFEDAVYRLGHAELRYETESESAYEVDGSFVPDFFDRLGQLGSCFPKIPEGYERCPLTITFLW